MITNQEGILICETCGEQIVTGLGIDGDRICPALERVNYCPDLDLTYKPEVETKPKSPRTGKETKNYATRSTDSTSSTEQGDP